MKNKVNSLLAIIFVVLSACFLIVIVLQYGLIPGIQLPTCCLGEPLEQPFLEQPSWKIIKDETADWEIYRNEEYGYSFKYPLGTDIYEASLEDFYKKENYERYTGKICIKVVYNEAVLYVNASENKDNERYAICRLNYWFIAGRVPTKKTSESLIIGEKTYTAEGVEIIFTDSDNGEILELILENGVIITYGTVFKTINEKFRPEYYQDYLDSKVVIQQMISTFRFID